MGVEAVLIDIIGRDKASTAFDKVAASAGRTAKSVDGAAAAMTRTGAKLTKAVTVPVLAIGAVSVKAATDWQKSMTLMQTAGGETADKVKVIGKGIQRTAVDTGSSLKDLNAGMYIAAKADHKWKAVDQLKILHAVAEGAKSENVDLGVAMTAQTSIMQSYGLGASKAVSVQNELIRGAGLAKTTYEEYAASLSNVVPLAAQLHISFAQVSGAIDTMTQHGDSAQRATDDLNNLIRNLAGQNNVASSAMQQLGINTVDLSKNLGARGLTGTLGIVAKALKQHTKNGMIVTDVHKAAALATKSLNEELGAMAPKVRQQSKELLNGSTNIKDYTKYAKSMGGDAGAQALQFLALYKSSKGFNDQLRSGNGVIKTSASEMLKLLGGSTSMNTALMLGVGAGHEAAASQKLFGQSVAEVAKAAKLGGADVLGWAETSNTMAVKAGRAKAELEILGVEIGTALIPAVSKMAGWVRSGVEEWDKLGSGWHKVIGYGVLFVAALGPVLTIGGRLFMLFKVIATAGRGVARAFRGTGTAATTATEQIAAAEAEQTRIIVVNSERQIAALSSVRAYQRKAALAGGVGGGVVPAAGAAAQAEGSAARGGILARMGRGGMAGFGVGLGMTLGGSALDDGGRGYRHAGGSILEGAGAGAMIGSIAGPWGAAAGGAIGGGAALIKQLTAGTYKVPFQSADTKELAKLKEFLQVEKNGSKTVSAFASTVLAGGKAMKSNLVNVGQAIVAHTKLAASAASAGLTTKDLAKAVSGSQNAFNKVMDYWRESGQLTNDDVTAMDELRVQYQDGKQAAQKYADVHGLVIQGQMKAVTQTNFLSGAIGNLNQAHMTGRQVGTMFRGELDNLRSSLKENGATLDADSGFGQRNIAVIRELSARALQHAQAVYQQTGSVKKADAAFRNDRKAIEGVGTAAGLQKGAVDNIVSSIGKIKSKKVKLEVDPTAAEDALNTFSGWYDGFIASMSQKTISAPKIANLPGMIGTPGNVGVAGGKPKTPGHAVGGSVADGWFTVGEEGGPGGWELGHKSGPTVRLWSNRDSRKMLGRDRLPGYASGTKHKTSTKYKGDASKVGTAIGGIGTPYSAPFDLSQVGIIRVDSQIHHAQTVLSEQIAKGLKGSTVKTLRGEIANLKREAEKQLAALKVKIGGADTSALKTALKGTIDDARTAFTQMISDVRADGGDPDTLAKMGRIRSQVLAKMSQRDSYAAQLGSAPTSPTAYDKLATAQQDYESARSAAASTVMGTFDVSTAGQIFNDQPATGSSVLAALQKAVTNAKAFGSTLKALGAAGLAPALLQQLAQAGPAALPQAKALLASGAGTLKSITSAYGDLTSASSGVGKYVADQSYGAGVASAQGIVKGLLDKQSDLNKTITKLTDGMLSTLRKNLKIHSPSRETAGDGRHIVDGLASGMLDRIHKIRGASDALAEAARSSLGTPIQWPTGQHGALGALAAARVHIEHLEIHDQPDPVAAAQAVTRRLAHLGAA